MNQKEFIEISKREVKLLNGETSESHLEAFREGYLYLKRRLRETYYNQESISHLEDIEDIISEDLDTLDWDKTEIKF